MKSRFSFPVRAQILAAALIFAVLPASSFDLLAVGRTERRWNLGLISSTLSLLHRWKWAVESDQGPQYVAGKGEPPGDSPLAAVRVWLVSESKKSRQE